MLNNISTRIFILLGLFWVSIAVQASIVGKAITYTVQGSNLIGYIAYDDASKTKRPGVLVVHDSWGLNQNIKNQTKKLAQLGYVALAVDMIGNGNYATHPKLANLYGGDMLRHLDIAKERFLAARKVLTSQQFTNPDKIAAVGYGYGGAIVLEMVRQSVNLTAAVTVYGILKSNSSPDFKQVKTKVLICNGEADSAVKSAQIAALKNEMTKAKLKFEFKSYADAKHAFSDPDITAIGKKFNLDYEYSKDADQRSWQDIKTFLNKAF